MHLFWVRSVHVCNLTHNIDLSGISLMIFGSFMGVIHYAFKCNALAYWCYGAAGTFSMLAILCAINIESLSLSRFYYLKTVLFMAQAGVGALSVIHWRWMK